MVIIRNPLDSLLISVMGVRLSFGRWLSLLITQQGSQATANSPRSLTPFTTINRGSLANHQVYCLLKSVKLAKHRGVFFQMKKPVERAFCQKVLFTLYHDITLLIQEQKE